MPKTGLLLFAIGFLLLGVEGWSAVMFGFNLQSIGVALGASLAFGLGYRFLDAERKFPLPIVILNAVAAPLAVAFWIWVLPTFGLVLPFACGVIGVLMLMSLCILLMTVGVRQ